MTTTKLFELLNQVFQLVLTVFGDCATTIMSNPLLYVPVGLSIAGILILFGVALFRKFGVKGLSSSGGRRRR